MRMPFNYHQDLIWRRNFGNGLEVLCNFDTSYSPVSHQKCKPIKGILTLSWRSFLSLFPRWRIAIGSTSPSPRPKFWGFLALDLWKEHANVCHLFNHVLWIGYPDFDYNDQEDLGHSAQLRDGPLVRDAHKRNPANELANPDWLLRVCRWLILLIGFSCRLNLLLYDRIQSLIYSYWPNSAHTIKSFHLMLFGLIDKRCPEIIYAWLQFAEVEPVCHSLPNYQKMICKKSRIWKRNWE